VLFFKAGKGVRGGQTTHGQSKPSTICVRPCPCNSGFVTLGWCILVDNDQLPLGAEAWLHPPRPLLKSRKQGVQNCTFCGKSSKCTMNPPMLLLRSAMFSTIAYHPVLSLSAMCRSIFTACFYKCCLSLLLTAGEVSSLEVRQLCLFYYP
jgi:hypothetical protein